MLFVTDTFGALITLICVVKLNHSLVSLPNHKAKTNYCMNNAPFSFVAYPHHGDPPSPPCGTSRSSPNSLYESRIKTGLSIMWMKLTKALLTYI